MLKFCDLIEQLLGEYCIDSTLELVDLYINGSMVIRDRQRLDRIFERAEKAVLVNYGHDHPLYERLQKCKVTPYQNQDISLKNMKWLFFGLFILSFIVLLHEGLETILFISLVPTLLDSFEEYL